jgi:CRP/FNR family cyclic AMP-dependent transcriptional regulator
MEEKAMIDSKDLHHLLSDHDFCKGLSESQVDKLASIARLKIIQAGDYIFRTAEPADCCYLIRHGHIAIEVYHPSRGPVTIQTVGPQKILGWSWLVPPYEWRFDGRAVEFTRGICLDADRLREACEEDHDLGYQVLMRFTPVIAGRLEAARLQLLDLYALNN